MLAKEPADISALPFPLLVQPKLDGIRAVVVDGKLLSRSLKPIPNAEIRAALEKPEYEGFDGEILVGDGTNFQASTSFVMAPNKTGEPWSYNVFDLWNHPGTNDERHAAMKQRVLDVPGDRVAYVTSTIVNSLDELSEFEAACLATGFEGVIARQRNATYKFGRSTPKSGPLWKIKRFIDFEAEVVGVYEQMHNNNAAQTNALGRTERSTAKDGMVPAGALGGLELRALNGPAEGVEFRCGTGFDQAQRNLWWAGNGLPLVGKVAKIKSFPIGVKDAPRFPVWLGWRDERDM
jgi:DNA ligase-1